VQRSVGPGRHIVKLTRKEQIAMADRKQSVILEKRTLQLKVRHRPFPIDCHIGCVCARAARHTTLRQGHIAVTDIVHRQPHMHGTRVLRIIRAGGEGTEIAVGCLLRAVEIDTGAVAVFGWVWQREKGVGGGKRGLDRGNAGPEVKAVAREPSCACLHEVDVEDETLLG
jgi:hypothetical protein